MYLFVLMLCSPALSVLSVENAFKEFETRNRRSYSTPAERNFRFQIFKKNLSLVSEDENTELGRLKGQILLGAEIVAQRTYKKELNHFADMSDEEFSRFYLLPSSFVHSSRGRNSKRRVLQTSTPPPGAANYGLKPRVDWTVFDTPVKDQMKCNSCYTFATNALIEIWTRRDKGNIISLSEQEILDCDTVNQDCTGGLHTYAIDYIIKNKIAYTKDYPYEGKKGTCKVAKTKRLLQLGMHSPQPNPQNSKSSFSPYNYGYNTVNYNDDNNGWSVNGNLMNEIRKNTSNWSKNQSSSLWNNSIKNTNSWNYNTNRNNIYNNLNKKKPKKGIPQKPNTKPPVPTKPNTQPTKPTTPPANNDNRYSGIKGYSMIPGNILAVLQALENGPIIVAMYVSQEFKFYSSGTFNGDGCKPDSTPNHAITALGYDLNANPPYIVFKNSWGADWGDKGYFKVAIGQISATSKGICLIGGTELGIKPTF